jgi:UPF0716 family protein affecting phage T7 exclusion
MTPALLLVRLPFRLDARQWILAGASFAFMLAASSAVVVILVLRLPVDLLVRPPGEQRPLSVRSALARAAKNLLGLVLVIAGAIMAIPGVPGQGVLTLLMGLLLLDLPGKRRLERRIFSRPRVLSEVNRLRRRFGREPLIAPGCPPP